MNPFVGTYARNHLSPFRLWVDEIENGFQFASLRAEWSELHEKSDAGPFLSWEWLYSWWRRIAPHRIPRLLIARDDAGRLEGILPLSEERRNYAGITARRWGFLGDTNVGSDYLDLVARSGNEFLMGELFAEHLAAKRSRIDVLELLDMPRGSLLADFLAKRFESEALHTEYFERYLCPLIEIRGEYKDYLKTVGRAQNFARRRKWLVVQPGFCIERAEKPIQVSEALSDFFELHRLRWERDGGSQGIESPEVRSFHRDAALLLAESGHLSIFTMRLESRPLASIYAMRCKDRFYFYQSGYDPEWTRRSVGLVLLGETISDAFEKRCVAYEFLRGSEPYKLEWANARRYTEARRWIFPTRGGIAFLTADRVSRAIKVVARKCVGQERWEQARRWNRKRKSFAMK